MENVALVLVQCGVIKDKSKMVCYMDKVHCHSMDLE